MARWHALHATYEERYVPKAKNLLFVGLVVVLPVFLHHHFANKELVRPIFKGLNLRGQSYGLELQRQRCKNLQRHE
jgi:hypothetical protein